MLSLSEHPVYSILYCPHYILRQLIVIITLTLCFQRSNGFCPSKCMCTGDNNLRVSCINAGLEVVPIQLNPDVKYINLTLNQIQNVDYTLQFYTLLEVLDLSQNRLDSLGSKHFDAQIQLRTLNLSRNSIVELPKDAFRGLKNLLLLDLSSNRIDKIHPSAMLDLHSLIELDLTNNVLVSMDYGIFHNMISLEILMFKNNELLEVPTDNLRYLRNLKSLDLSGNYLEFIRNESFDGLKELSLLTISGNVINDFDVRAFDGLSSLRWLNLADNNLTIVPTQQLSKLLNLSYLSMSGNFFPSIPPVALLNLFHLRELHLNRLDKLVKIDSRAFVDNTFLQIISLDNNPQFADLPPKLFHGNPNLIDISMIGNDLRTLDAIHFPLDHLNRLRLGGNPFVCNCSILWLWRLTTGKYDEEHPTSLSLNAGRKPIRTNQHDTLVEDEEDDDDENDISAVASTTQILVMDNEQIGCDLISNGLKTRRILKTMSEGEIRCPAHIITVISAILSVLVVIFTGASILFYLRAMKRKRRRVLEERKNVTERIVPQQVDKFELERYLAAQEMVVNEYQALRPWEIPVKEIIEEPDHYEKFEDFRYDSRRPNKPHVVYV